jgi:hypothetical protein
MAFLGRSAASGALRGDYGAPDGRSSRVRRRKVRPESSAPPPKRLRTASCASMRAWRASSSPLRVLVSKPSSASGSALRGEVRAVAAALAAGACGVPCLRRPRVRVRASQMSRLPGGAPGPVFVQTEAVPVVRGEAEGRVVGARGRGGAAGSYVPAVGVHGAAGAQGRVHEGAATAGGTHTHGLRRDAAVPDGAVLGREARRAVLRGGGGDLGGGRQSSSACSRAVL